MSKPRAFCDKTLFLRCCLGVATIFGIAAVKAEPLMFDVARAEAGFDQRTGEPVVSFRFTEESARRFALFTAQNVGHAAEVRVDGKALSRPVIREPILGGSGQIMGHFSAREVQDLAARLSSGTKLEIEALPN
jgi:preprotein translocase subunit SecD